MIRNILEPYVSVRFKEDGNYRNGHIRVINPLPGREIMGVHIPDMKRVAARLAEGKDVFHLLDDFESCCHESLAHEELVVWGFIINRLKIPLGERLSRLSRYIPVIDNWAVCDSVCCNATWAKPEPELWSFLSGYFRSCREFEVRFALILSMARLMSLPSLPLIFSKVEALDFERIESLYTDGKEGSSAGNGSHKKGIANGKEPYYVRMAVAWLLATALARFPDQTRSYLATSHLPEDVVRLYIRKAKESFRTRGLKPL